MRLHHLWPWKSQNRIIPVNWETIRMTTIASKLFWTLYLGYYRVLHYIVYGLRLGNFDISSAFTFDQHPRTCPLSSNISLRSQITCNCCNPVQKQPQLQHVPSVLVVPLDGLKLNRTGSVSFDSVFSRYHGLFWSSVYFNTNFSSIAASRILCSLIRLLRTTQHYPIQQSTSPLRLRLVELSQFLHFTCKFSLF